MDKVSILCFPLGSKLENSKMLLSMFDGLEVDCFATFFSIIHTYITLVLFFVF